MATELSTDTPRVFGPGHEVVVRVTLRNDGFDTWDSASEVYLSYHWLRGWSLDSATPARREGARTTLPRAVGPGETITIEARLERPEQAGAYFLRWDMVQEGVRWFSERSVRPPPAHRVFVLPPLHTWLAVVPAVFALWLWVGVRWRPATSMVAWCGVSLWAKQALVLDEAGGGFTTTGLLFTPLLAVGPAIVVGAMATSRARPLLLWSLTAAGSIAALVDLLYFRYFGDLPSLPVLRAFGQTGHLLDAGLSLARPGDAWFVADVLVALPALLLTRATSPVRLPPATRLAAAAVATVVFAVAVWLAPPVTNQVFTRVAVARQVGLFGYHAADAWLRARAEWLRAPLAPAERDAISAWFGRRAPLRATAGPAFGAARGRNVVVVQVESLQGFVIGLEIGGQPVTPNLNRWWHEGLAFTAMTDQTGEGRTSDAEFLALTSLLPLEKGAVAFRYPDNGYVSWAGVLRDHGYTTLAAIPFSGAFWNRAITLPAYGFTSTMFDDAFAPGPTVGWGLNDRDFFAQMVPALARLPRPFLAWLITLSNHYPYTGFPSELATLDVGDWAGTSFGDYLQGMRHLDTALGDLRAGLERAGLADDTVLVIFGDHDAGFPWEGRTARAAGLSPSFARWLLEDRVPALILNPGDGAPSGPQATAAGLIDLAPTMLGLLGVDAGPLPFMGRDLLAAEASDVRVRPQGGWRDDEHLFHGPSGRCLSVASGLDVSPERCEPGTRQAAAARAVATQVIVHGLQSALVADSDDIEEQ